MAHDFLDHWAHLVDFDRENDEILALVIVFLGSFFEAGIDFLDTGVDDVRKTDQHWSRHVTELELIDKFTKVNGSTAFARRHHHVAFLVDREIVNAPVVDVVELSRVFNTPFSHTSSHSDMN